MQDLIENKSKIFTRNTIICLGIIALAGFLIRLFYFPEGIPITLDGTQYFWYANDLSLTGIFPENLSDNLNYSTVPVNNGWPTFLSVFFYFFNSENFLDYMALQRYTTTIISVVTIIPVFILCRKFCGNKLSLIGASLFVFQPRIIENSLSGLTDPLFILLELSCLVLFLQNDFKFKYLSFAFLALACLVRYEGIVLILPLSFLFIFKNRRDKIIIPRFLIALSIFLLVLLPMLFVRMDTIGYDGVFSHSIGGSGSALEVYTVGEKIVDGSEAAFSLIKSAGLAVFPIFFILLPLGFFAFFKNRNFDKYTILLFLVFMLTPAIYGSFRGITEPRYFLTLFPILSLFSIYTIKEITKKFNRSKLILIIFVVAILLVSIVYLDYNKSDYEYELDAYHVGLEVSKRTSIINDYYPEVKYVHNNVDAVSHLETFPVLSYEIKKQVELIRTFDYAACIRDVELESGCRQYDFPSLNEFISYGKNQGLTHIVADGNENRPQFLKNVFESEEKYTYLSKIYDSSEHGYNYHLKIFQIDYEKFDSVN